VKRSAIIKRKDSIEIGDSMDIDKILHGIDGDRLFVINKLIEAALEQSDFGKVSDNLQSFLESVNVEEVLSSLTHEQSEAFYAVMNGALRSEGDDSLEQSDVYSDELKHAGVKGMKWGVVRAKFRSHVAKSTNKRIVKLNSKNEKLKSKLAVATERAQRANIKVKKLQMKGKFDKSGRAEKLLMRRLKKEYKLTKKTNRLDKKVKRLNKKAAKFSHTDELLHAGVKGMKWGVRRYLRQLSGNRTLKRVKRQTVKAQNELRLTKAKIKQSSKASELQEARNLLKAAKKEQAAQKRVVEVSSDYLNKVKASHKKLNQMSNKEIKDYNERIRLEREFNAIKASQQSAIKKMVKDIASTQGKKVANAVVDHYTKKAIDAIIKKGK